MNHHRKFCVGLILALFTAATMHAGLLLSGNTEAFFQPVSNPYATITNSANGLDASFRTGIPARDSFKSGVKFNGQGFQNVEDGDTFSLGFLTYYNGVTRAGTSSGSALLDLYLDFADPALGKVHLTTIKFGIDATLNHGGNLNPDFYAASFLQPSPVWLGDELVKFTINGLSKSTAVAENSSMNLASISVMVLIPETSTYALTLGIAAFALILFHRRQPESTPA